MSYHYKVYPPLEFYIEEQANFYQRRFSTGKADFYRAFRDTLYRIAERPHTGQLVKNQPDTVRAMKMKANRGSLQYSIRKKLPLQLDL